MPPLSPAEAAADLFAERIDDLAAETRRRLLAIWDRLAPWDDAALDEFHRIARPLVQASAQVAVELAGTYSAAVFGEASPASPLIAQDAAARLYDPLDRITRLLGSGATTDVATTAARSVVDDLGHDTAWRSARQAIAETSPPGQRWQRRVTGESCRWCLSLASAVFNTAESATFGHTRCVVGSTVTHATATRSLSRRWYAGEFIVISTAAGDELTITPNHPVLTNRGWVPAGCLTEADDVVRCTSVKRGAVVVPDEDDVPSSVEDRFRAAMVGGLVAVPFTSEHFHGDAGDGEVHVVPANSHLSSGAESTLSQHGQELTFAGRRWAGVQLSGLCSLHQHALLNGLPADGIVGLGDLGHPFVGRHLGGPVLPGLRPAPYLGATLNQHPPQGDPGNPVGPGQGQLALPCHVSGYEVGGGSQRPTSPADLPPVHLPDQRPPADAGSGRRLLQRLAGQVSLDRIVVLRRVNRACHVYNLSTSDGWYAADNIVVHNCDCIPFPVDAVASHNRTIIDAAGGDVEVRKYKQLGKLRQSERIARRRQEQARRELLTETDPARRDRLGIREQEWETRAERAAERVRLLTTGTHQL